MGEQPDGWGRHADEQRRAWLRLSYAERLQWLEQAKQFATAALGAARRPEALAESDGARSQDGSQDGDAGIDRPIAPRARDR